MTLRLRLALALVALAAIGMAVFGVTTYELYSHSEYQRLDDQLSGSVRSAMDAIRSANGGGDFGGFPNGPDHGPSPGQGPGNLPAIAFAEYVGDDVSGAQSYAFDSDEVPALPSHLPSPGRNGVYLDANSKKGSTHWRVYVTQLSLGGSGNGLLVIAQPSTDVDNAVARLVLIELSAGLGLVILLGGGSWLILRRGLRPLEHMAGEARSISAGDLSQRVSPSDNTSEVGQLGFALNTMLTEIEGAFRERDATEQRLRQFLADASHELRTPLTSIQGFAELFRMGADEDRVQLEVIFRRIEEESARMKTLVEDLLLLARLDETRPTEREPVDLSVLAADACTDAVAIDRGRPVTLDAPLPVVVSGDRDHLRQAIANLVTNAIRHTPSDSPIEVTTRLADGVGVVTIRDHGTGLEPDALAHVFDRFWQADRARVGSGSGLGLSIVAAIAEEHGGTIAVENVDPGACFTLRIPIS